MEAAHLAQLISMWLNDADGSLREAFRKTVDEGLFLHSEVMHQLQWIKEKATEHHLKHWQTAHVTDLQPKRVLALHAGNLPYVEFQDIVAILLSGHHYIGKVSRKSPYLAMQFLRFLKQNGVAQIQAFSTDPMALQGLVADEVLFSGSPASVDEVKRWLQTSALVHEHSRYLIREAHFSLAWIPVFDETAKQALAEAILRFDGKGCRSVKVVVCPESLLADSCHFTDYIEQFWITHGGHSELRQVNEVRFAFNKAMDIPQLLLEHYIIQESAPEQDMTQVIYWVKGNEQDVYRLTEFYGNQIQCVYTSAEGSLNVPTEPLYCAQWPELNWKPDGMDPLAWLCAL